MAKQSKKLRNSLRYFEGRRNPEFERKEAARKNKPFSLPAMRKPRPDRRIVAVLGCDANTVRGSRRLVIDSDGLGLHAYVEAFGMTANGVAWIPLKGTQVDLAPDAVERLAYVFADELPPSDGASALAELCDVAKATLEAEATLVDAERWTHRPTVSERLASFQHAQGER